MNCLSLSLPALTAFALSLLMGWWVKRPGSPFYVIDKPNNRSLHVRPTPRSGGVAIVAALGLAGLAFAGAGLLYGAWLTRLGIGGLLLAMISYRDDRAGVPILARIAAHTLAAALVVAPDMASDLPALTGLGVILAMVWMTNLFNFMDGSDGLAAAMAIVGFSGLAWLGFQADNPTYTSVALLVAASVAGFLPWNFPPARLFMGDTGSIVLGFLAGAMLYWGWRESLLSPAQGLLLFFPFVFDASLTLMVRALNGDKVWRAHRRHLYQRLYARGWTHARILLCYLLVMTVCLCLAMLVGLGVVGEFMALSSMLGCGVLAAVWVYSRGGRESVS